MEKIDYWGHGSQLDTDISRRNVRYIAFCNKATFLRTVDDGRVGTKNWVKDRMSPTGNNDEINLINHHLNEMLMIDNQTHEIIKTFPLKIKPIKEESNG